MRGEALTLTPHFYEQVTMSQYNDISYIEAYLQDRMGEAERRAFEAELSGNEPLRQEVDAYQKIYSGFNALKENAFSGQVAQWITEAKAQDQSNIVPIKKGAIVRTMWRRLAVAASVVLLLGIAAAWWVSQQYSDEKLVAEAYISPKASGTMGGQETQASLLEKQFETAHQFFKNAAYADATREFGLVVNQLEANPALFDQLTHQFYLDNAKWTGLLAQFAAGQISDEAFSEKLAAFANDPASDYAEKAKDLKRDLGSVWRKIGG